MKKNKFIKTSISLIFLIISLLFCLFFKDYSYVRKCILGVFILSISMYMLWQVRKDKYYVLMMGIIVYINITICFSDCISNAVLSVPANSLLWQNLRKSNSEILFLESLALFLSIFNCFISNKAEYIERRILKNKSNLYCYCIGFVVLIFGLLNGYSTGVNNVDGYESNTSAMFEYCTLFFLLTWYYAGKNKSRHMLLLLYGLAYITLAVFHGDRSSAFPMILLIVILYLPEISLPKVFCLAFMGIFASNIISVYRNNYSLENFWKNFFYNYGLRGFFSDTVSFSYYTGISIVEVKSMLVNTSKYFIDYVCGIFLGGGFGKADVTTFCKQYAMNKGGGMCVSSFYFWFGFLGIVLLGIIVGWVCKKIQNKEYNFYLILKIYITIDVFRWYLYSSFDFFRGCLFVLPIIYSLFNIIDMLVNKNFKIKIYR